MTLGDCLLLGYSLKEYKTGVEVSIREEIVEKEVGRARKRESKIVPLRMARIEHECLRIVDVRQVAHDQMILQPIREDRSVATIRDELVGELCDGWVQIVHNHELHGSRLL